MGPELRVELLDRGAAADEALVRRTTDVINRAYAVGEAGLWVDGSTRTDPAEVAGMIAAGGAVAAWLEAEPVGFANLRVLDGDTADLGMLSVLPEHHGSGAGRRLLRFAEELAGARGIATVQLELLVPRGWTHPAKDRLRAWYLRRGYRLAGAAPFEAVAAHAPIELATPCEFLVFRRPIGVPA